MACGISKLASVHCLSKTVREMKILGCLIAGIICTVSPLFADSPAPPFPYITTTSPGYTYFRMVPRLDSEPGHPTGFGIAYQVGLNGVDEELWRTEGWYSFEVFLSSDGDYLAAMGPWNMGREPKKEDLAVSFYRKGKLLKRYSVDDLVKDKTKVLPSVSHYMWLARDTERLSDKKSSDTELRLSRDNIFHLKTCDGIIYEFDMTTGGIKKSARP